MRGARGFERTLIFEVLALFLADVPMLCLEVLQAAGTVGFVLGLPNKRLLRVPLLLRLNLHGLRLHLSALGLPLQRGLLGHLLLPLPKRALPNGE